MSRNRKDIFIICVLVLLAFGIRFALLKTEQTVVTDAVQYLTLGKNIITGKGFVSDSTHYPDIIRPPLHPVMIGISHLFFKDLEFAGRLVTIFFGSLLIIFVFKISREIFGRTPAFLSAIVVALHPVFTSISLSASSDATFVFFCIMALFIGLLAIERKGIFYFLFTGITFAMSYLTRQNGLLFFSVYFLFTVVWLKIDGNSSIFIIKKFSVLLLGFLCLLVPYIVWVHGQTGIWMEPGFKFIRVLGEQEEEVVKKLKSKELAGEGLLDDIRKYEAIHHGLSDNGREIAIWEKMNKSGHSKSSPPIAQRVKKMAYNMYWTLNLGIPSMFPSFFLFFILFGFISQEWSKKVLREHIYLGSMFIVSVVFVLNAGLELRYLAPSIAIGAIWAGSGIMRSAEMLRRNVGRALRENKPYVVKDYFIVSLFVVLTIGSLVPEIYKTHFKEKDEPVEQRSAGLWIRKNRPNAVVMSRKPQISLYADCKYVVLPFGEYGEIMRFAEIKKVNIIVVDERYIPKTRPSLTKLLSENELKPEGLKVIYKDDTIPGNKLLLYEVEHY